jgi:hypothetical protein
VEFFNQVIEKYKNKEAAETKELANLLLSDTRTDFITEEVV